MEDSRIKIFPEAKVKVDELKSTLPDGSVVKAQLEYVEQDIELSTLKYHIFVGSTAGKKGFPNQDFAGFAQKKILIDGKEWFALLAMVADGVSSREKSEGTSKSIVDNSIKNFSEITKSYSNFESLAGELWNWIAQGAQESQAPLGVSTVSAFLLAVAGEESVGIAINCGDSRVYWATPKYVETAKVHTDITSPKGSITYALGADRENQRVYKDVYTIKDSVPAIFLCTDTFAYRHDGVHFPSEMIPSFGRGLQFLNDHLTAISIRRIND